MKYVYAPPESQRRELKPRCCARCKTPGFGCARQGVCPCHAPKTDEEKTR